MASLFVPLFFPNLAMCNRRLVTCCFFSSCSFRSSSSLSFFLSLPLPMSPFSGGLSCRDFECFSCLAPPTGLTGFLASHWVVLLIAADLAYCIWLKCGLCPRSCSMCVCLASYIPQWCVQMLDI